MSLHFLSLEETKAVIEENARLKEYIVKMDILKCHKGVARLSMRFFRNNPGTREMKVQVMSVE